MNMILCPKYERVFKWLGKRWNGLILRCLASQPLRFSQLRDCLKTISDKVLTQRLIELTTEGLITHVGSYYQLTDKGKALHTVLDAVQIYADNHIE